MPLLSIALFLVVIRFIVVPLAFQREERRDQGLPALSALPPDCVGFVLRRNSHRHFPPALWPEARAYPSRVAGEMGLPADAIKKLTGLRIFSSGEWLFAHAADGDWWLLGPLGRLVHAVPEAEILHEENGIWRSGDFAARAHGRYFLLAPNPDALSRAQGGWLSSLPDWPEIGDLLVAGDLLLYGKHDDAAVLGAFREIDGTILADGLGWNGADCEDLLELAAPLAPPSGGDEDLQLENFPFLRRSPPWDPEGRSLPIHSIRGMNGEWVQSAMRLWEGEPWSAYSQSVTSAMDSRVTQE